MKHAYLILAHGDFALLQCLVSALDDERNDLYVHVDKGEGAPFANGSEKSALPN